MTDRRYTFSMKVGVACLGIFVGLILGYILYLKLSTPKESQPYQIPQTEVVSFNTEVMDHATSQSFQGLVTIQEAFKGYETKVEFTEDFIFSYVDRNRNFHYIQLNPLILDQNRIEFTTNNNSKDKSTAYGYIDLDDNFFHGELTIKTINDQGNWEIIIIKFSE